MKHIVHRLAPVIDILLFPFTFFASILLLGLRKAGIHKFPLSKRILFRVGVFPLRDHYYDPMFNPKHLRYPRDDDRSLPGIDMNTDAQLEFLQRFHFNEELRSLPLKKTNEVDYYYDNSKFGSGDGEYWYNVIRAIKPKRIIEVGAGYSTKMAVIAIEKNQRDDPGYTCEHTCIEPYRAPWLEVLNVKLIRDRVETIGIDLFEQLEDGDILYIDSSHVIRPQGDVLFEILEIFPTLKPGVLIHIHDVFTPSDYPAWDFVHFYNEQYLVEAFLAFNPHFKVIGALNFLQRHHPAALGAVCPVWADCPSKVNGSFWIRRE